MFKPVLEVKPDLYKMEFYNTTKCYQNTESRPLDTIRGSLLDPNCEGADIVYGINMDVSHDEDRQDLLSRYLLYGVVTYTGGSLGRETIHSQGHRHAVSKSCQARTGEVYQIWEGKAYIYMQTPSKDGVIDFYTVEAKAGDIVIVHPEWYHAIANSSSENTMTFGAWCIRDYGFEYDYVRSHKGLAYYSIFNNQGEVTWMKNSSYTEVVNFHIKIPRNYSELGLQQGVCIYEQYKNSKELFSFLTNPLEHQSTWNDFIP